MPLPPPCSAPGCHPNGEEQPPAVRSRGTARHRGLGGRTDDDGTTRPPAARPTPLTAAVVQIVRSSRGPVRSIFAELRRAPGVPSTARRRPSVYRGRGGPPRLMQPRRRCRWLPASTVQPRPRRRAPARARGDRRGGQRRGGGGEAPHLPLPLPPRPPWRLHGGIGPGDPWRPPGGGAGQPRGEGGELGRPLCPPLPPRCCPRGRRQGLAGWGEGLPAHGDASHGHLGGILWSEAPSVAPAVCPPRGPRQLLPMYSPGAE